jgi:hypothetical protein
MRITAFIFARTLRAAQFAPCIGFGATMHRHVKLKLNDGFFGCFQLDNQNALVAPILYISAAKMLIVIQKKDLKTIQAGDRIHFTQILGVANIRFKNRIVAKIHWVKDLDHSVYLAAECKFCKPTDEVRDQIGRFVDSERFFRGQGFFSASL